MKVKEESEKTGLKLNIQEIRSCIWPHISSRIDGNTMESVTDLIFLTSNITVGND